MTHFDPEGMWQGRPVNVTVSTDMTAYGDNQYPVTHTATVRLHRFATDHTAGTGYRLLRPSDGRARAGVFMSDWFTDITEIPAPKVVDAQDITGWTLLMDRYGRVWQRDGDEELWWRTGARTQEDTEHLVHIRGPLRQLQVVDEPEAAPDASTAQPVDREHTLPRNVPVEWLRADDSMVLDGPVPCTVVAIFRDYTHRKVHLTTRDADGVRRVRVYGMMTTEALLISRPADEPHSED